MRNFIVLSLCTAILLCLTGCGNKTPEDRMTKAREYISQRDMFSAESELRKIIEKSPDDPMVGQARYYLAQIYNLDKRYDEAIQELEVVTKEVSQDDPLGRDAFKLYLQILTQTKQFDTALQKMDEMEKLHANSAAMKLNFKVGRADLLISASKTTEAREILVPLLEETTHSQTAMVYTDLILKSHGMDGNTTAGIEFLEAQYNAVPTDELQSKMALATKLIMEYATVEDYEYTRKYIEEATAHYDSALAREVQPQIKVELANDIAQVYQQVGNLAGVESVYQIFLNSGIPQLEMLAANELAIVRVRNGDTSAAVALYQQYGKKLANAELQSRAVQLQEYADKDQLSLYAPLDTQTLTLRFKDDTTITLKNFTSDSFSTQTMAQRPQFPSSVKMADTSGTAAVDRSEVVTSGTDGETSIPQ